MDLSGVGQLENVRNIASSFGESNSIYGILALLLCFEKSVCDRKPVLNLLPKLNQASVLPLNSGQVFVFHF